MARLQRAYTFFYHFDHGAGFHDSAYFLGMVRKATGTCESGTNLEQRMPLKMS